MRRRPQIRLAGILQLFSFFRSRDFLEGGNIVRNFQVMCGNRMRRY